MRMGPMNSCNSQHQSWTNSTDPEAGSSRAGGDVPEVDDKEPHHCDAGPPGSWLFVPAVGVLGKDDSDDQVTESHANGSHGQDRLPPEAVDPQDGRDGSKEHGNADHAGGEQTGRGVAQTELLEDCWSVVQDGVDAGPLLER